MCDEYNGWTNRETWAVALYINNDQGWQESVLEALRAALPVVDESDNGPDAPMLSTYAAGEIVRENVETLLDPSQYRYEYDAQQPESLTSALHDIGSLYRVNWTEIGASFLSDIAESGE